MIRLTLYIDFISPYAYLAFENLPKMYGTFDNILGLVSRISQHHTLPSINAYPMLIDACKPLQCL
jgi:2-hydroxychromene-2-carboxylate isomerase